MCCAKLSQNEEVFCKLVEAKSYPSHGEKYLSLKIEEIKPLMESSKKCNMHVTSLLKQFPCGSCNLHHSYIKHIKDVLILVDLLHNFGWNWSHMMLFLTNGPFSSLNGHLVLRMVWRWKHVLFLWIMLLHSLPIL